MVMTSPLPILSPEAEALVARRLVDRGRATRKLRDVLARAVAGDGATASIRTISVLGSYARGAERLGDVDLTIEVDDPREQRQAEFDDYMDMVQGKRPHGPLLRELRCSGSSIVSAVVVRRYDQALEPAAPERWRPELAESHQLAEPPMMAHIATGQPLAGPSILLYVRGDSLDAAVARLQAIPVDPTATRFERTTGVPLLDPLTEQLGVDVQYKLAYLVRAGGLDLRAVVLRPSERVPAAALRHEATSYTPLPGGKARLRAVLAAIDHLDGAGVRPERLSLAGTPLVDGDDDPDVLVTWSTMALYAIRDRLQLAGYSRLLFIGRAHTTGPWIGLDCRTRDAQALDKADHAYSRRIWETPEEASDEQDA
jgi:predicted nucleotidyltransferase